MAIPSEMVGTPNICGLAPSDWIAVAATSTVSEVRHYRRYGGMTIGNANHGFVEVLRLVTQGVKHGPIWGTGNSFGNVAGAIIVGHAGSPQGRY
jgi:hypothetical protein